MDKAKLTQRLQKEFQWSEAVEFKNAAIKENRAAGMTRPDASDAAWLEMEAKFPPLPPVEPEETPAPNPDEPHDDVGHAADDPDREYQITEDGPQLTMLERLHWIETALGQVAAGTSVYDLQCPDTACVGWLQWALKQSDKFYTMLANESRKQQETENADKQEIQMQCDEIDEMIVEAVATIDTEMAKFHKQPEFRRLVHDSLPKWCQRFDIAAKHSAPLEDAVCEVFSAVIATAATAGQYRPDLNHKPPFAVEAVQ